MALIYLCTWGGFRGVSEVSRNHLGFVLGHWVRPFSATKFHEAYTACWIARSVIGFCFELKLRKSSVDLFSLPQRKIGDLCKNLRKGPNHTRSAFCKSLQQPAVWKLLSKISRIAPAMHKKALNKYTQINILFQAYWVAIYQLFWVSYLNYSVCIRIFKDHQKFFKLKFIQLEENFYYSCKAVKVIKCIKINPNFVT